MNAMKRLRQILLLHFCLLGTLVHSQDAAMTSLTSQLAETLPNAEAGVAVGLIENGNETVSFVGNPSFSEETLFEFGSITKVFTAIALAQLADEGVLRMSDSINPYLPKDVQDLKWETVTFEKLATHSAGLPRLPPNMNVLYILLHRKNPYVNFDKKMLYDAVEMVELEPVGEFNEYSNFGFGLLGTLLADITGLAYGELVESRIFAPLDMRGATTVGWSSDNKATPLTADGTETSVWDWDALAGVGAARGSLDDAMKFLKASMAACDETTPLALANCRAQQATEVRAAQYALQGLGWIRLQSEAGDIVWHNGGTGGFRSFLGFNVEKSVGIVLLTNVADADVTNLGLEFLASLE